MKVVLDTNICLDFYLPQRDNNAIAIDLIKYLIENDIDYFVPCSILNNFFYVCTKRIQLSSNNTTLKTSRKIAWQLLNHLTEQFAIIGMDISDVYIAKKLQNIHNDFEDNQIIAAAMRCNADYLISNDEELIKHATIACLSANDFLKLNNSKE